MALTNEYEKLLRYLESQGSKSATNTTKPKPDKKEVASKNTKKMLEEATIEEFSDLPHTHTDKRHKSTGFDVEEFESLMRSKLVEEYKTRQSYERPYVSVSELYVCLRQNYYVRKRYQSDIKAQFRFAYLYLIQKIGHVIHSIFQDLYNFSEVEKNVVSERYKVKGRADAIKGNVLYEIKSIDESKFKGKYFKEHYFQGLIYAYILIAEYGYKIEKVTIIYVLRNLKTIHSFDLPVNMDLAKSFLEKATILLAALDSDTIPEVINATKEQCRYCPYKSYCKKDGYKKIPLPFLKKEKEEKSIEETETKKPVFLL